jgi:hypothetical protein
MFTPIDEPGETDHRAVAKLSAKRSGTMTAPTLLPVVERSWHRS